MLRFTPLCWQYTVPLLLVVVALPGCSQRLTQESLLQWQRQECRKRADPADAARCLRELDRAQEGFEREHGTR